MSKRVILAMVLVVLLALPVAVHAQPTDPVGITEKFNAAANAGDAAGASALLAEDATAEAPQAMSGTPDAEGKDPSEQQVYEGKAKIEEWLEGLMSANGQVTLGECVVEGELVTCEAEFESDALAAMGVGFIEGELEVTVVDGLIQAYAFTPSPESLAKLQAASATMAVTGGNSLIRAALVIVLAALMVAGVLGLRLLQRRWRRAY